MFPVSPPYQYFYDLNGEPLNGGYIYVGEVNKNPETDPITIYWDAAGLIPAAQPIRTVNGVPVRSGRPAVLYATSTYSMTVRDKAKKIIFTILNGPPEDGKVNSDGQVYTGTHDFRAATVLRKRDKMYETAGALGGTEYYKIADSGALGAIIEMTADGLVLRSFAGVAGSENEGVRLRLSFAGKLYRSSNLGVTDYELYDAGNAPPGPPGTIILYAGGTAPTRCLSCPASPTLLLRADYPALFAALGAERWRGSAGAAPSDSFYMPYFPDFFSVIKAGSTGVIGESYAGNVINHVHPYLKAVAGSLGSGDTSGGQIGGYTSDNTSNPTTGGSNNIAAGMKLMFAVAY